MRRIYFPGLVIVALLMLTAFACKSNSGKQETKDSPKSANETQLSNTTKESTSAKETSDSDVKLSVEEKKELNVFFSNFSEAGMEPFAKGKVTEDELINFGVLHLYKNNNSLFEKAGVVNSKIKEDKVSEATQKYFGKNISSHKSTSQFKYKNGYYFIPSADGEAYTFSQVERLTDNGKDFYTAYINVYTAGSGWTGDVHGLAKEWGKDGTEAPELTGKYKAIFEKKNTGNVLVEYLKENK